MQVRVLSRAPSKILPRKSLGNWSGADPPSGRPTTRAVSKLFRQSFLFLFIFLIRQASGAEGLVGRRERLRERGKRTMTGRATDFDATLATPTHTGNPAVAAAAYFCPLGGELHVTPFRSRDP